MTQRKYGNQSPTFRYFKDAERTDGEQAVALAKVAGIKLLPWQCDILSDWLSFNGETFATQTDCLSIPRQNGKTKTVACFSVATMLRNAAWVVYTSHLQKTSTETFEEIRAMLEAPKMAKYVKEIRQALGREEIVLTNGAHIKFLARTRNGGRGQHGDVWICDEAQELTDEQQGSFVPLLSASKNPKTIYIGTPPDDSAGGEVFRRLRERVYNDEPAGVSWNEWAESEVGDTADKARWYRTNPSMGYLINERTIDGEHEQLATEQFARERLGWWAPLKSEDAAVISRELWKETTTTDPPTQGIQVFAVKVSGDGRTAALVGCRDRRYIEAIKEIRIEQEGYAPIVQWLAQRVPRTAQIVVDGQTEAIGDALTRAGVPRNVIMKVRAGEYIAACASFVEALRQHEVVHADQEGLTESATNCTKRQIGSAGGWGFKAVGEYDSVLVEAAALAYWGSRKTKRDPEKRQRIC